MSSGHGFHVHGAHEHEVEHQAQRGIGLAQYVAIFSALLSTLGAVVSYMGSETQNEALLYKNEAVLKQTQASDLWNFYQAKSSKGHLMEIAADVASGDRATYYRQRIAKYQREKKEIKKKAEALEAQARKADVHSQRLMNPHSRLLQALTFFQIAISLASITVLTRKTWLFGVAGVAAAFGAVLWIIALLS